MTELASLQWVGVTGGVNFGEHHKYCSIEEAKADDRRRGMGIWYLVAEAPPKASNLQTSVLAEAYKGDDRPVWFTGNSVGGQILQISFSGDVELLERIWKLLLAS